MINLVESAVPTARIVDTNVVPIPKGLEPVLDKIHLQLGGSNFTWCSFMVEDPDWDIYLTHPSDSDYDKECIAINKWLTVLGIKPGEVCYILWSR